MIKINVLVENNAWKKYFKNPNNYLLRKSKILSKKNVLFRFPEKNLLSTLNFAYKIKENKEFINHNIIDLRILKRVVLNNV